MEGLFKEREFRNRDPDKEPLTFDSVSVKC